MYATFGNLRFTILDMIAEGDRVSLHWRVDATHQGNYLGVAVTGKSVTFQGIALRMARSLKTLATGTIYQSYNS